jgi:hypothetical protein
MMVFLMTYYHTLYVTSILLAAVIASCPLVSAFSNDVRVINNKRRQTLLAAQQQPIPRPGDRAAPQGGDMAYTKINIDRQSRQYNDIRQVGGVECVTDVYARSLQRPNIFWFTAKVARCTGK